MFSRRMFDNTRPDGIPVMEIVPSAPGTTDAAETPQQFVPLKRSVLTGEVIGPLAALRLTLVYGYTRAQYAQVLEAAYRFPLPGDAAVTSVRVRFGDVEIQADLKERAQAEAEYEQAKQQGQQAALATRESPDVFTLQIAGLQPDQDVTVETSYVQLARTEGERWTLRVPLTTAPRYVRSDELTSRHAQGQPLALLRDPGHRFALDLEFRGAEAIDSRTHTLALASMDGNGSGPATQATLRDGEVLPDRDCVLSWRAAQDQTRPSLRILTHSEPNGGPVYFLALVAPPATHERGSGVSREAVLLVDHSGSMQGPKWQAADWAVTKFLSDLAERDAFALGVFHNTATWFAKRPQDASEATVQAAIRFLHERTDSGGTELGVALEQALALERVKGERARHVLLVTDAQVSDADRILRLADSEAAQPEHRRISLLCIDAAPNSALALELAERGGGVARFLTSAPEEEDITTALDEVLADWAEPIVANLKLEVGCAGAEASGRQTTVQGDRSTIDLGALPAGRALWVAGRVPHSTGATLAFRLLKDNGTELAASHVPLGGPERPALKSLFGARRVLALEYLLGANYDDAALRAALLRLGYVPDEVLTGKVGSKLYAENVRADTQAALTGLLVRESLAFGLACSQTAFVAVRREAGKRIEGRVIVANALPSGWSEGFLGSGAGLGAPQALYCAMAPSPSVTRGAVAGGRRRQSPKMAVLRGAQPEAEAPADQGPARASGPLYTGVPSFVGQEAVLFDTSLAKDAARLPDQCTLTRLTLRFPDGAPLASALGRELSLAIYVGDASSPRATVRLADLVRITQRPLNLRRGKGDLVRLVLVDRAGVWSKGAPKIEVTVEF